MTRQRWQVERAKTRPTYHPEAVAEWRWSERRDRLDPAPIHGLMSPRTTMTYCGKLMPADVVVMGFGVVTCPQCQEARR